MKLILESSGEEIYVGSIVPILSGENIGEMVTVISLTPPETNLVYCHRDCGENREWYPVVIGAQFVPDNYVKTTYTAERHESPDWQTLWQLLEEIDAVLDLESLMRKGFKAKVDAALWPKAIPGSIEDKLAESPFDHGAWTEAALPSHEDLDKQAQEARPTASKGNL
jgi:hypothetical protein